MSAWFIAQIIKIAHYPEHLIKSIRIDNIYKNILAKSLIKRLIDRPLSKNCKSPTSCWHHSVLQTIIILNSFYCNHNGTPPRYSNYVESGLSEIFPICVSVMFHKYRYHHRSIHPWALRIHIRYLSVIHKISWITQKGLIHSFTSPYADTFWEKFQTLGGD